MVDDSGDEILLGQVENLREERKSNLQVGGTSREDYKNNGTSGELKRNDDSKSQSN
jgi:hypothetical protein